MINSIRQFLAPPVFDDEEETRLATLLNRILWAIIIIGSIYTIIAPFILGQLFSPGLTAAVVAVGVWARSLMRRGRIRLASTILLVVFNFILFLSILLSDGVIGASYPSLVLTTVLAGVLLGGRGAFSFAVINSLIGLGFMLFQDAIPVPLIPQSPLTYFTSLVVYVFFIAALLQASADGVTKILASLRSARAELTAKNQELKKFTEALESTIAARTSELDAANLRSERRARQFEAIARISRAITQTQDFNILLDQVTELISEQFNFYHTGVFLLDANNEFAVLIAANSLGGKRMLQRNHRLRIGQTGIVGYVAGTGFPRIALDTGIDAVYFNNPDLPDTRSEMALPLLRKGNEVIGVLDVQSRDANAFSQEDVRALTTLADQVAIAIENSHLFETQKRVLSEAQAIYNREFRESWLRFTKSKGVTGIQRRNLKNSLLSEPLDLPGADEALRSGDVFQTRESDGTTVLTLPIKLREQTVGVVNIKGMTDRAWTDDELDIVQAIMERAALSIENARLLDESMVTADRERVIGEISAKISSGTQVEEILKTAVRELGTRIPGTQVTIEVGGGG